ncbi:hypothetical protein [Gracilibacillus alcaliphilus]|uniref:hypothetical protein n=1 Tax=Gracilibacillus alcaliphilus TaxID=1401441 RepID=UPI00195D7F74|nr:hypothetical protein [Gracilibacillus alcaliphilus]MBM7678941.1 hypothetical protein [Gracilibacillus alcaliphilus]
MILSGVFDNQNGYAEVEKDLKERFSVEYLSELGQLKVFDDFEVKPGYAHCMYHGKLKEGVVLTELEIAMICDSGYSFFGGHSNLYGDGRFEVKIWTD